MRELFMCPIVDINSITIQAPLSTWALLVDNLQSSNRMNLLMKVQNQLDYPENINAVRVTVSAKDAETLRDLAKNLS